ncbi:MAG TPA: BPSS1780 family membrane protein [Methylophilaceae bacterium]|nr:BPSS1780 family membrane protein [Methylophilaceae bacterium]
MNMPVVQSRQVGTRRGLDWLVQGFALFRRNPLLWVALFSAYLLMGTILSMVPVLGPILLNLVAPVFVAGFMIGCRALDRGGDLEISHLFAGFRQHAAQLITIGGIYMVGIIIIVGIMFLGTDQAALQAAMTGERMSAEETRAVLGERFLLTSLIGLLLLVPLVMAYWFAPVLAAFHGLSGPAAMKESFFACLRNIGPFLIYGVVSMVLLVVAAIPFGLGLLVMIPTMIASLYMSYKDVFADSLATQVPIAADD